MADEHSCQFCGGVIRFRMIRGVCVPLHDGAELCPTAKGAGQPDECRKTLCPKCGGSVYFVRHNGGAVWFEELGQPWAKHPCFDQSEVPSPTDSGEPYFLVRIAKVLRYFPAGEVERSQRTLLLLQSNGPVHVQWLLVTPLPVDGVPDWKNRPGYLNPRRFTLRFFDGSEFEVEPHLA